jgi:GT2 family glycosyltransferase
MFKLGTYLSRMYEKHQDPAILWCEKVDAKRISAMQATCEAYHESLGRFLEKLRGLERDLHGRTLPDGDKQQLRELVRRLGFVPFYRGVLNELEGYDPGPILEAAPLRDGETTSIIVLSHNSLDQTRRCLEALRTSREEQHPIELHFVDNGSTDGSAEFLAAQPDVHLIANETNLGAPRARNQALAGVRGEWVVVMDNDVMVTPEWLGRLLYHAHADPKSGCIGCVSDRAGQDQQIELTAATDPDSLRAFADARAREFRRQFRLSPLLSSFLLLMRRERVEEVGGFDERFSPWGFEDDDFTLRTYLAGYRNRVALDVFVRHEGYSGPKLEAHRELLQDNWTRFAEKWGLPEGAAYGNYDGLSELDQRDLKREDLFVTLERS